MARASSTVPSAGSLASAYIRVSSRSQDHASQRSAIERAAQARGDTIETWYSEKKSARTMSRDELRRLLAESEPGLYAGNVCTCSGPDSATRPGSAQRRRPRYG